MDVKNIGTVLRNVDALGVEKAYIVDNRRSLPEEWEGIRRRRSLARTSASASRWTFVKRFDGTEQCLAHLERHRYVSFATSPHVKGRRNAILHEADYAHPRLAIWFGNESHGISDLAIERSACRISIPMFGIVESLNLGTTTGIVPYEATKQRREYQRTQKRAIRNPRTANRTGAPDRDGPGPR